MIRTVALPHGAFAGGRQLRHVELRPPSGADEAWLLEEAGRSTRAELVSGLLERCVVHVEDGAEPGPSVRAFTAGDREALLLQLYAAAFGERMPAVLDCPSCEERMDLDLRVSDLLVAPYATPRERYEARLGTNGSRRRVRFSLPTGADQEAAARERDLEAGVRVLVERCVEPPPPGEELYGAVSAAMARLDPQAEITLSLRCPECGAACRALHDAAAMLLGHLAPSTDRLLEEVHSIALHYHWSERDILALDVRRRQRYLDLLADADGGRWS